MSDVCDTEIFNNGKAVAVIADRNSEAIEALVVEIASQTGVRIDWHYVAGRGIVRAIGDLQKARAAFRSHTNDYLMVVEEDGTWTR